MIKNKEIVFDFYDPKTGNLMSKQYEFFCEVNRAVRGQSKYRIFNFGGGIRGGKTYTCLFALLMIAKQIPNIRVHIVRDTIPNCLRTVEQSLLKMLRSYKKYSKLYGNYKIELHNGSEIHFFAENYVTDKDLDRFKGLETNIFFLEQVEELQEKTFNKSIERAGTWIFPGMPPGIILTTFNPTSVKWVRDLIYKPAKIGKPLEGHYTVFATAHDNPHVPGHLFENWKLMDKVSYQTFVEGDWEASETVKLFCYMFDVQKHVQPVQKPLGDIYISFDFNVDPAVALLAYVGDMKLHIFKEYRIRNSNIYELCDEIKKEVGSQLLFVTGDASGNFRSHTLPDCLTTYDVIMNRLEITRYRKNTPNKNLGLRDSRLICNSVLQHYDIRIDPSCQYLIEDLMTVEADEKGTIEKSKDPLKSHLLDCFRYYCNTYFFRSILAARY